MEHTNDIKIFYNGTIYSKFIPLTTFESIVTNGDKIEFCGKSEEAIALYGKKAVTVVNLNKRIVIPGFVDSHIHLDDLGGSLNFLDLRGTDSIKEVKERLRDYHLKNPNVRVIIGMGWDQESFSEGRWPNRWDVDEIETGVPVFLERFCEHAAVINTKMLEYLNSNAFPDPIFPMSPDGKMSGVVKEEAAWFFKEKALEIAGNLERNLASASNYLLSLGITSVGFVSCGCESVDFLSSECSKLGLRVFAYLKDECIDRLEDLRNKVGTNPYFQINGIKLFVDGALGAGTAALREPYADDSTNEGILYLNSEKLTGTFERLKGKRVQFSIHAIGDKGIDAVIDAISKTEPNFLLEPRIEHCTVLRANHVSRLKELGIGVSVQPAFVIDDWWAVRRLGNERSKMSYPLATLFASHVKLGISTDSPVSSADPWLSVDSAVNRGEREKREILKYSANERVDLSTALYLYTAGSASLLMNDKIGSLEVGNFADFAILSNDPFGTQNLRNVKVIETIIGGNTKFKAT